MMKDITSFLPVVLWQGFLRPIDLRIEIETFNEDLQVQGSSQYLKFRLSTIRTVIEFCRVDSVNVFRCEELTQSLRQAVSFNTEFAYGLFLYEFYYFFYNRGSWNC